MSRLQSHLSIRRILLNIVWVIGGVLLSGCGTTRERDATEQLVLSNAVDRSISAIDFRPMTGRKVYLDTSYLKEVKGSSFVNAAYITSALRQQIAGAGCLLQDSSEQADLIIEPRVGTLGSDDHRVTFGIPENNSLSSAASLLPNAPSIPSIPEIAVARRDAREAAAKIAAFAYDRETRKAVWQSGVRQSIASAKDTYVLGVGPFQAGTIREGTKLAGSQIVHFGDTDPKQSPNDSFRRPPVDYTAEVRFQDGWPIYDKKSVADQLLDEAPEQKALGQEAPTAIASLPEHASTRSTDADVPADSPKADTQKRIPKSDNASSNRKMR
ncbi:hypothetical protein Q31b_15880 [Novipirellula aureliae]|uniref:Uncharacterized protein n=1 Tax=Novipirellula aureliae TaxID=2527966 RepID=A0A5C6E327_9BACT|nr:DUF6655 family protein [Novipirellula aureliae]TWU44053.1 hypothetical protein Q31b_15880 [Novipirellula aureliae]